MTLVADDDRDAIIWMRPEATGRGKPPAHSREQIAKAAIAIADSEGIDAVSMRRVAAEIGAGTMSLYRYVRGKDELHALMVDYASDPYDLPAQMEWTRALRAIAVHSRQLVRQHPWYPVLAASIAFPGPRMLYGFERMMSYLDDLGLGIDEMLEIVMMAQSLAFGFAQNEMMEEAAIQHSGLDREQWELRQAPYVGSLVDSGQYPYMSRVIVEAVTLRLDSDGQFERFVQRFLAGVAATLPADPPEAPP
jgi:AcrR family transcriptional regulator